MSGAIQYRTEQLQKGKDPWIESNTNRAFTGAISSVLDGTRQEVAKVTVPELMSQLGNITPAQVQELINKRTRRLDVDDVTNRPAYRNAIGSVNRFRTEKQKMGEGLIEFEKTETAILEVTNELARYADTIADDPDFDRKMVNKKTELLLPLKVEVGRSLWDRYWNLQGQAVGVPENATVNPLRRIPVFPIWAINKLMIEPDSPRDFEERYIQLGITDPDRADKYYKRHKDLWPELYK